MRHAAVRFACTLGVAGAVLAAVGCTRSAPATTGSGTAVIVFIDFSSSVQGPMREAFKREIDEQILASIGPGDRIVVAPIHDKTLTEFRPLAEGTLPPRPVFNGWFDNVIKHNRELKAIDARADELKVTIKREVAAAFRRPSSERTDIFSSLVVAQKLFHSEPRRKVLVLMSDMIEDSPLYNFENVKWSSSTTAKMLLEVQAKDLIPDLSGVCVYVTGVSARSADMAQHIGNFWANYFRRARADLDASRYAHVLLHWPPSSSCRASG